MLSILKETINTYSMLSSGKDVLVALSGGADSVALLRALSEVSDEYCINLSAIHINHNLRGDESMRDELFCRKLCESLKIPLIVESINVGKIAEEKGESIELCARNLRYELFSKHATGLIATAHTASDNAETVLYNLSRGSGLTGVCGIPPVRDNIIRPIINCSREDVIDYLNTISQDYVNDSTNDTDDYTRNKIRHNVVPELLKINPLFISSVSKASVLLKQDDSYLSKISNQEFEKNYVNECLDFKIKSLDNAILSRVLAIYFNKQIQIQPEHAHITQMLSVVSGKHKRCSLPKNMQFESCSSGYCINMVEEAENLYKNINLNIESLNEHFPNAKRVSPKEYKSLCNVNNLLFKFSIDCDKIQGNIVIRTRHEGDSFRPVSRNVTKTLRKLLSEIKATKAQSNSLLVLCDDNGIFYTNLFGIDERVVVTNKSKNIITLYGAGD